MPALCSRLHVMILRVNSEFPSLDLSRPMSLPELPEANSNPGSHGPKPDALPTELSRNKLRPRWGKFLDDVLECRDTSKRPVNIFFLEIQTTIVPARLDIYFILSILREVQVNNVNMLPVQTSNTKALPCPNPSFRLKQNSASSDMILLCQ